MPELPEVETVRRGLAPALTGARIEQAELRAGGLRFPFAPELAESLRGRRIIALGRRAKYLLIELCGGETLISHLGMSGSWRLDYAPVVGERGKHDHIILHLRGADGRENNAGQAERGKHDHIILHLRSEENNTAFRAIYNDPRRFGFLLAAQTAKLSEHKLLARLGIEPLGNRLCGAYLAELFGGKKAPLKAALLDQSLIAGLGNIYVCEALWRAGLSPLRAAGRLSAKQAEALAAAIRSVLEDALASGGSHLRNYRQADGSLGYFQHQFQVYGRGGQPCRRCGAEVLRLAQSGRSSFYCEKCQK